MEYVIPGVAVTAVVVWAALTFNRLVKLRNHVRESWADIDAELQRRYDLIPRLVEVVKGFAAHETELLTRLTELREAARAAGDATAAERGAREAELAGALHQLAVRVEAYPALTSDAQFLELQKQLVDTEDRIGAARRFYNANVRGLNTLVEQLPSLLVARAAGFETGLYFAADEGARAAPVVGFGAGEG